MKLIEIIKIIEDAFPKENAYDWDNVGLLVGDKNSDIKKVLLTLDITEKTLSEAIENNCQLILSHHPILFSPIKQVTTDTAEGRIILTAARHGISIYAAHTNCDVAKTGINEHLSGLFELENAEALEENGLGRVGTLKKECTLTELCSLVKALLNLDFVRFCGEGQKIVKTVAIGSGACSDSIPFAIEKGADVMITGDTKYHSLLDFKDKIAVIDAGHYGTEIVVCDIFKNLLSDKPVEVVYTKSTDIYKVI